MTTTLTEAQQKRADYLCDLYVRSDEDVQERMLYGLREWAKGTDEENKAISGYVLEQIKIK